MNLPLSHAANVQVRSAFKQGLSCEEIAADLGYNLVAVKQAVADLVEASGRISGLPDPRSELMLARPEKIEPLFNAEEAAIAKAGIMALATEAEMEGVKLKACELILDEHRGRKDVLKQSAEEAFNIAVINASLERARIQMQATKARIAAGIKQTPVVDVEAEKAAA